MSSWWDLAYRSGVPPWDSGTPPDELVQLVDEGHLKPCKALDVGCGTGTTVTYLAKKGFDAYGLDISKVAIRKAVARARDSDVKCNLRVSDFLNTENVSKLSTTFDLILDLGCFHSLSAEDRIRYKESLDLVSHPSTKYLLWCFLRGSRWSYGPPGVERDEAEKTLRYLVVEKRSVNDSFREMLFYVMQRESVR